MTFEGFTPPIDDYFRMPNSWINICAEIDSLAELKVVQYVLRHTWGYQGFSGARKITIDEFMHGRKRKDGSRIDDGTGLSKQSVITAVEAAAKHGYLVCDKDTKDLARQKKYYQLAMKADVKHLDTVSDVKGLDIGLGVKNLDIPGVKDLDHDVKELDSDGLEFRQRSEKYTLERHLEKDTLEKQEMHALSENKKHSHDDPIDAWNCHNWCTAQGKTCADYQAAIDAGWHETPTGERPAIQIGAPDGHPKDNHPPADHRATASVRPDEASEQVAIANTPGGAVAPPTAAVRQSYTTPAREASSVPTEALSSHERNDGAATEIGSEPRASDDTLPDVIDVLMHPEKLHASGGKRKGKKVTQAPPELSPEVTRILDDWDSLHKKPVPRTEGNINAAALLVEADATREEMKGCRDWLPTTDRPGKPWYRKIGVHLPDIAAKLEQYRSLEDMPPETRAPLADKARKNVRDAQYEAALQKTGQPLEQEEVPAWLDFDNYVGNGPEERQRLVERGRELKAQGFCPDL